MSWPGSVELDVVGIERNKAVARFASCDCMAKHSDNVKTSYTGAVDRMLRENRGPKTRTDTAALHKWERHLAFCLAPVPRPGVEKAPTYGDGKCPECGWPFAEGTPGHCILCLGEPESPSDV